MMRVDDSIRIAAPPQIVWAVTRDVEGWPEWTPTVTSVRRVGGGPLGIGSIARIKQPMQREAEWVVTEFADGERFAWESRRRGLRVKGTHEILPDGAGTTNVLRVEAGGAVAALLWPLLRVVMRRALMDENRGLKKHCEEISRAASESADANHAGSGRQGSREATDRQINAG